MESARPSSRSAFQYAGAWRWFGTSAFRTEWVRITLSVAAELAGFSVRVAALGGVLWFIRRLQSGDGIQAWGEEWVPTELPTAALISGGISALFLVGSGLAYLARCWAIEASAACTKVWMHGVLEAVGSGRLGVEERSATRLALVGSTDSIACGRVVWQAVRGLSSGINLVLLSGVLLWMEPWLTLAAGVVGSIGLLWQFRVNVSAALSTEELERTSALMRSAWLDVVRARLRDPMAISAELPASVLGSIKERGVQLRVIEDGGVGANVATAFLLGGVTLFIAWSRSHGPLDWELLLAYAIGLRALVGLLESNARRAVAIHRFYPNVSRYWRVIVTGAPSSAPHPNGAEADDPALEADSID